MRSSAAGDQGSPEPPERTIMVDVAVVGSGPAGLACAIESAKSGFSTVVLEKGSVADAIRRFPTNLVWFSTPDKLEIGGVPFAIAATRPSRIETLVYYQRVAARNNLDIRTFDAVTGIRRKDGAFVLATERGREYHARFAVIATGYFDHPKRLDVPGEELPHVHHYYDEPFKYHGCSVAVIGGRNSAVEACLELYRQGARVVLIHRGVQLSTGVKYWIQPDFENRVKAGEIRAVFGARVREIRRERIFAETDAGMQEIPADHVFVLVGFRPDADFLRAQGILLDPETLAPRHSEESFETNVPGLFVAGSVAAGSETNKIFVENGRLHGASIVAAIRARSGAFS